VDVDPREVVARELLDSGKLFGVSRVRRGVHRGCERKVRDLVLVSAPCGEVNPEKCVVQAATFSAGTAPLDDEPITRRFFRCVAFSMRDEGQKG
jgi:hypothetical protein